MKAVRAAVGLLALAAIGTVVAWLAGLFEPPPQGVVPVAWDRETCVECRMHIGDPSFAAQLQTSDARVLNFDDPGCLFRYLEGARPDVAAMYFHHHAEPRWLSSDEMGFVRVERTPMGYGLAAVEAQAAALTLQQARSAVAGHSGSAPEGPR